MIIKWLYNFAIFLLALTWLPKLFGGKRAYSYKAKLGFQLPQLDLDRSGKIVWIHAVSVGEMKAASVLAHTISPQARLVVSTVTEAGYAEAQRLIPYAEVHFFLPLDFSWTVRKCVARISPDLLLLVEGEFWYNLIDEVKRSGGSIALVNGKLSARSARRFAWIPGFSSMIFDKIDCFCLQHERYKERFARFVPPERLFVTGNLKFDREISPISNAEKIEMRHHFGLENGDFVLVLGSTHEKEEGLLLYALRPLFAKIPNLVILLAPRHTYRFGAVEELLVGTGLRYQRQTVRSSERVEVVLVDMIGQLLECFEVADIAVVCGSFIPGIGGHNLFEPAGCGIPVLFGAYTEAQDVYAEALVEGGGGCIVDENNIADYVHFLYTHPSLRHTKGMEARRLVQRFAGAAEKTLKVLESKLLLG
jgi:3-deoxy-D-manno-octulosonic-acid transferase